MAALNNVRRARVIPLWFTERSVQRSPCPLSGRGLRREQDVRYGPKADVHALAARALQPAIPVIGSQDYDGEFHDAREREMMLRMAAAVGHLHREVVAAAA